MVGNRRQGWAIYAAMLVVFLAGCVVALSEDVRRAAIKAAHTCRSGPRRPRRARGTALRSAPAKPIAERLLALAKLSSVSSERVVRRAWRSSQRLGAELDILVVRDPNAQPSGAEREQLESLRRIAAGFGAHLVVEQADDLVEAVVRVARQQGTTYILMGAPTPLRGPRTPR